MTGCPLLSVIIAARNDEGTIGLLLSDLGRLTVPYEAIVVDGGSSDFTAAIARVAGARMPLGPVEASRSGQLRAGAAAARAPLLLFLDAYVRLAPDAVRLLDEVVVARPPCAMVFRERISAAGISYRLAERWTDVRVRRLRLPRGDQGLLVRREDYLRAGGYPRLPGLEDIALARALCRVTQLHLLDAPLHVPARPRARPGLRRVRSWIHLIRHLLGTSAAPPLNGAGP